MNNEQMDFLSIQEKEAFYSWFASLYLSAPNTELLKVFSDSKTMNAFTTFFTNQPCQTALKELSSYVSRVSLGDLRNEFNSLFVVPNKSNNVPPYESCFREKQGRNIGNLWGNSTGEVARFYLQAGYEASNLQGVFAPDHIGIELAFVAKLCADRLHCLENQDLEKADCIELLRKSFLEQHVSMWIEEFSIALGSSPSSFFYKYLSQLVVQLIFKDMKSS